MAESTSSPSEQVKASESEPEPTVDPAEKCEADAEPADSKSNDKFEPVNPHLEEIMKCPSNEWQLEKKAAVPLKSLEDTPFTIVDTKDLLDEMMMKLREVNEIGLATMRYTFRSFYGICSLVQIATRTEVFLVDAITLKDEVKVLSEILTNPGVLKVVHTAREIFVDNIQKDLGIYLINMFSISLAWRAIKKKNNRLVGDSASLEALLKKHCDLDFDSFFKGYRASTESQDSSERPLTAGRIKCSRMEVQYLLHIYDVYRNMLIDQDLLKDVYTVSNKVCRSVWHVGKVALHSELYLSLYRRLGEGSTAGEKKANAPLSKLQLEVLKVLHDWRHTTALKHNESRSYILTDMAIYRIASTLPKDVEGIKKSISPDEICPLLEEYYDHLRELVVNAVVEMASDPESNTKIPFSQRILKRKGTHTSGQTHAKKKDYKKPVFNGRRGPHLGHARYPMNHVGHLMGPRMGPPMNHRMGPRMGPWIGPQMGLQMGSSGIRPGRNGPFGMGPQHGMYQPGPFFGW